MSNTEAITKADGAESVLTAGLGIARDKVVCSEFRCAWHGLDDAILRVPNPFDEGETIYACPKCKEVNSVVVACDEPGCWKEATCGTPTLTTYRRTCGKHIPSDRKQTPNAGVTGLAPRKDDK